MNRMDRSPEERSILNPGFCSLLLWHAAVGYDKSANSPLPFDISFLVLPLVLHRTTRVSLPKTIRTSIVIWLDENTLFKSRIAHNARILVPFTKDALMFGGLHNLLDMSSCNVAANYHWKDTVEKHIKTSTEEVRTCAKSAEFVGRWLAKSGSPSTVMAILGVRL